MEMEAGAVSLLGRMKTLKKEEISMENTPQIFENSKFGKLTVIERDGEPWFVGSEVAGILGYKYPKDAIRDNCKYAKILKRESESLLDIPPRGIQIINEKDIYRLIMRSNLPSAEEFQDWVVDEVLPSIRKHGIYATESFVEKALSDPDHMIEILRKFKEEKERRVEAEKTVNILTHVNKTYTCTEVAKENGFKSAQALNKYLAKKGIQFKQNHTWVMYSKYAALGYESIKQEVLDSGRVIYHRRITQRGREFINRLISENKTKLKRRRRNRR